MRSIDTQHEGAGLLLAEDDFATESIEFLETNSELKKEMAFTWGVGSDEVAIFECLSPEAADEKIAAVKAWRALKFDAGFGWITGPTQFGGRGLPASFERIFVSLEALYDVPDQISTLGIGLGMVAPTILAHGTHLVKEQYLRALYRADIIGCQLFSEPSAGSDLAGVTTRAIRHGNEWVLNGQKVWTSGAHFSDIGEILCRTNADAPKHQGLTAFLLDMHAPGVEVRPLRQMTGGASFNEVFLTDVRVPDSYRLGEVDGGWGVAITTLMNERATIVSDNSDNGLGLADGERLIAMVQHLGLNKDPLIRQQLAKLYIDFQVARYSAMRAVAKVRSGASPGPELSLGKLALTRNLSAVAEFVGRVLGSGLVADTGEWGTFAWGEFVLGAPGYRVAGGTDEVMRNVIGERVLGLPKEPRVP